jgi:hypothetical protein
MAFTISGVAQNSGSYEYVIVPEQFEFLRGKDTFSLNTLTKLQLEKYGFTAYFPSEIPNDLQRCDALYADVEEQSSLISTRITLLLRDCNGFEVLRSAEGRSKEKEVKKGYTLAFRGAFEEFGDRVQMIPPKVAVQKKTKVAPKVTETVQVVNDVKDTPDAVKATMEMPKAVADAVYKADAYTLQLKDGDYVISYKDAIIGKLKPTSIANSFIVSTTRFTGIAQRTVTGFKVEGEVPGSSKSIILDFKRQ